jgi:predicted metal-dependent peptidase
MAGRYREGHTLHLVLDTSGSMHHELPRILGIIAAFAEANHVDEIHLVQADGNAPVDEWIPNSSLQQVTLRGLAGGDLVAPLLHLANDAQIEAVVVVTDGAEPYPAFGPPFQILWALPQPNPDFAPGYGTILVLEEAG